MLADRADPANRNFAHPFPEQWTIDNRGEILKALYTIMIGHPTLKSAHDAQMQTRFPMWYRLVGSAIENATRLVAAEAETKVAAEDAAASKTAVEISFKKTVQGRTGRGRGRHHLERRPGQDDTRVAEQG